MLETEIPEAQRFTDGWSRKAFRKKAGRGWIASLPAEGPPFEKVGFVFRTHPLAGIVDGARSGQTVFARTDLEGRLGLPVADLNALRQLGKVGLAVRGLSLSAVSLQPTDVRAAKLINEARHHVSKRGYRDWTVIEAFLPVRDPRCSRINVNDIRRLGAHAILESDWDIGAEDLLNDRRWIRIDSRWTVFDSPPIGRIA